MERRDKLAGGPDQLAPPLDAASADWISALTSTGPACEAGLTRLHELLVRVAAGELHRREVSSGITGAELDDLAHQAAADAMLAIIAKLDSFRGESRFTTWAYRFAVLEVSAKLGRHYCAATRPATSMPRTGTGCRTGSGSTPASEQRRPR